MKGSSLAMLGVLLVPTALSCSSSAHSEARAIPTAAPGFAAVEEPASIGSASPSPSASVRLPSPDRPEEVPRIEQPWRPSQVLTEKDVAFFLDEERSNLMAAAEQRCAAVQESPRAFAACVEREQQSFRADVFQFTRDEAGRLVWVVFDRQGNALSSVFQSFCELVDEADEAITVRLVGVPIGIQPLARGQPELRILFPDRYSLVLEDPRYAELVYRSKVGFAPPE